MLKKFDFKILPSGDVSVAFLERNLCSFNQASQFIKAMPYRRNMHRSDVMSVLNENCGTCSTKHALLKRLAVENEQAQVKLMMGIFKMNGENTPGVGPVLKKSKLSYLPEAHSFLLINGVMQDFTSVNSRTLRSDHFLVQEEIEVFQIHDYKVLWHKSFLQNWLKENKEINLSLDEVWKIREECIAHLSNAPGR